MRLMIDPVPATRTTRATRCWTISKKLAIPLVGSDTPGSNSNLQRKRPLVLRRAGGRVGAARRRVGAPDWPEESIVEHDRANGQDLPDRPR